MTFLRFAAPALAVVVLGTGLSAALADTQDPAQVIHERQQLMKDFGAAMKTIGGYLQGAGGTHEDVAAAAGVIVDGSGQIQNLFPEGTGMDVMTEPETGAKPAIWAQWDEFVAEANTLGETASAVQAAATAGDDTALAAAFDVLGNDGCGGCHQTFRQKLD